LDQCGWRAIPNEYVEPFAGSKDLPKSGFPCVRNIEGDVKAEKNGDVSASFFQVEFTSEETSATCIADTDVPRYKATFFAGIGTVQPSSSDQSIEFASCRSVSSGQYPALECTPKPPSGSNTSDHISVLVDASEDPDKWFLTLAPGPDTRISAIQRYRLGVGALRVGFDSSGDLILVDGLNQYWKLITSLTRLRSTLNERAAYEDPSKNRYPRELLEIITADEIRKTGP